ncbi:MAG: hypothetical protein HPY44_10630 [Armatimonadetes bacterium]|nr:hypothetical protein [Armatimonadota bacterium]
MKATTLWAAMVSVVLMCSAAGSAVTRTAEGAALTGEGYSVVFGARDGAILRVCIGSRPAIAGSGEFGLWQAKFQDGTVISAADFAQPAASKSFRMTPDGDGLRLAYRCPEIDVEVRARATADGVSLSARMMPHTAVLMDFAIPARMRFDPKTTKRLISPANGNSSVGMALNGRFFSEQPTDRPSGWSPKASGPKGYIALLGGPLDQRPDRDPPTTLKVTDEGREWLGASVADRAEGTQARVNRPPTREQVDLVLVDSPNGPYLSAAHLGGEGFLWRIGGGVGRDEANLSRAMIRRVVERLAASAPGGRTKLGLLALVNSPMRGGWSDVSLDDWRDELRQVGAVKAGKIEFVELDSAAAMIQAVQSGDFLAILNPYGEWAPVPEEGGMDATVRAVGEYVKAGGNWFEVGGYPFFYEMRPMRYMSTESTYPAAFADFFHLETEGGQLAVYRAQPLLDEPWQAERGTPSWFTPGRLACGGDQSGGYFDRPFATYVLPEQAWSAPTVILQVGADPGAALAAYCQANGISRRLDEKMSPEVLEKFRNAVLLYYAGNCVDKTEYLDRLPVPTLLHFAEYLKGGFDKQYPDHLPPNPNFGTGADFRAFFDRAHQLGHLIMPYTNPTWWCYDPKGPTFQREGEEPLLKRLDGSLSHEQYGNNPGYTVCHWHPAVQAANREVVRQFSEDYPVDILFQDQCGARGWQYDTNPASPSVDAYTAGLISMIQEDCERKPLSTESGWDRVVNHEAQLCGMSWGLVPTEGGPTWRQLTKYVYHPSTWSVFPVAQYIAHDKCSMVHHDLGQFVTNRETLSWTLGLGFGLSYRVSAASLDRDQIRGWLEWLDRIQKSVCSKYVGEPLVSFEHDRGPDPTTADDGIIRAQYGPVKITANLGPAARVENGVRIAPYGFVASAPGVLAGCVEKEDGGEPVEFVSQQDGQRTRVWVYSREAREVTVPLPDGATRTVSIPLRPRAERILPPDELAKLAPVNWPGEKPYIGVLDFSGVRPSWTSIQPVDWLRALERSRLAEEFGLSVVRITGSEALYEALKAEPRKWLAIVNPYGETFPSPGPGRWKDGLSAIRDYVNSGGIWCETAGYSFYNAIWQDGNVWKSESVGPQGMGIMGLPIGGGEVDAPGEPLTVPDGAQRWLGADLAGAVARLTSPVNRALPRGPEDPGHVALVAGRSEDFIGGYRLDGWGWLWRVGGFNPNPDVAVPVMVKALEFIATNPVQPIPAAYIKTLWSFDF